MGLQPGNDFQQTPPLVDQFQRPQWPAWPANPAIAAVVLRVISINVSEAVGVPPLADQGQGIFDGIDPCFLRYRVCAEYPMPEFPHFHPAVSASPEAH